MRMTCSLASVRTRKSTVKIIRNLILLICLCVFSGGISKGQPANYSFAASSGTFTPISGTTATLVGGLSEGSFNNIPVGFTFKYWNTNYTTVSASANGWMTFGQAISNPLFNNDLINGTIRPLVAPLWDDLSLINAGDFTYSTTGTAGQRVFTAQWLQMKWNWRASAATISFQVKLYEADGKIEFIYNQDAGILNLASASIGLSGPLTGVYNFVSLSSPYSGAVASSTVETTSISDKPASGQVFSFSPVSITISSPSQVPAGNIGIGTTNSLLSSFQTTASGADALLKSAQFTTTGSATGSDISNLKLFYSASPVFPGNTPVALIASYEGPGTYTFPGVSQLISGTGYFWITGDVNPAATIGHSISVGADPVLNFAAGIPSGTISAGGLKTISGSVVVISSPNPAVPAGPVIQNTIDNVIYRFDISVSEANETITGLQITTAGTYVESDVSTMIAYYSEDAVFSPSTDLALSIISSGTGPGTHVFPFWTNQTILANTTGYIFITADIPCTALSGSTISVNAVTTADVTFLSGTKSGSGLAGGTKTIQDAIPDNVTGSSAAPSASTALLTWTNPANCFDEIMIVGKEGLSITGVPSGNGSAYTPGLLFGTGTLFDGGYVVYKGSTSPQTVSDLALGTAYYFKFFSRKGSNWSSGVEVNILTSPPSSGEYRSAATGSWGTLSTWEIFNGNSWVTPTPAEGTPTSASGKITIRNGHNVTVNSNVTVDQVTVDAGGIITVNNRTFTIANGIDPVDCIVNGKITGTGNSCLIVSTGVLEFNSGAIYDHALSDGTIPTATWNTGSTCIVTSSGNTAPGGLNQLFYNFTWDSPAQKQHVDLGGYPGNVTGTFTVISTGTRSISPGGNVTYASYLQTGGTYSILGGGVARTVSTGNFTLEGGQFLMSDVNGVTGTLHVSGNFSHAGGTITETATGAGSIIFNGTYNGSTGMQTFTSNVTISNTINFTVNSGAYLQMASETTVISGNGSFTLSSGGTLGITSANGISASGTMTGNVQTASRTFDPGANYIYNLSGAQITGSGLPIDAITGNITISAPTSITTTNSVIEDGTLTVDGSLTPGLENHLIAGNGTLTGSGIVKVTRTSTNPNFLSQYAISNKSLQNLLVDYAVTAGGQVVSPVIYGNLRLSNTSGTNTLGGDVTVNGTLYTTSGGTLVVSQANLLTASVILSTGIITIEGTGKATVSNFINNGILNLNSTSSSIFSLILSNYSGTGTTNIELYLTGGGDPITYPWHYISSPVAALSTDIFTTVPDRSWDLAAYYENNSSPDHHLRWVAWDGWDYSIPGYPSIPVTFNTLTPGRGYNIYFYEPSVVKSFGGILNATDVTINPLSYSGLTNGLETFGWNLLGNPFSATLNWDGITKPTGVDNAIYFTRNNASVAYVAGVGVPSDVNGNIPPMQGFFVKANAPGLSMTLPSFARLHSAQPRYKGEEEMIPLVRLKIESQNISDETVIRFNEKATTAFDSELDAYKFSKTGSYISLWTTIGSVSYSINGIPFPETMTMVPVGVNISESGTFKLTAIQLEGLDNYNVYLIDNTTGVTTNLKTTPTINITASKGMITDRFIIKITNVLTGVENPAMSESIFNIYASKDFINIQTLSDEWDGKSGSVELIDLTGRTIRKVNNTEFWKNSLIQIPAAGYKGIYVVKLQSGIKRYVGKVIL